LQRRGNDELRSRIERTVVVVAVVEPRRRIELAHVRFFRYSGAKRVLYIVVARQLREHVRQIAELELTVSVGGELRINVEGEAELGIERSAICFVVLTTRIFRERIEELAEQGIIDLVGVARLVGRARLGSEHARGR